MSTTPTSGLTGGLRSAEGGPILQVKDLHVTFPSEAGLVQAVRGLSFDLYPGQTMALVGESGSGKSVTSLAVMGLLPDSARVDGSVRLAGDELLGKTDDQMSKIRGSRIAMVFQDPLSALTPVYTIGDQITEALHLHQEMSKTDAWKRAVELLGLVGIPDPAQRAKSFPFEFSGGMRQRVMIAMAMANNPDVIIADEPTTALDVTIQAQVLEVLRTAQQETGAAMILITHDLGVVAGNGDQVTVMYAGRPVEQGNVDDIFYTPRMPYTIGLLGTVPRLDQSSEGALPVLEGTPPSVVGLPVGCPFAPRCPMVVPRCRDQEPDLGPIWAWPADPAVAAEAVEPVFAMRHDIEHQAACWKGEEIARGNLTHADIYPIPKIEVSELAGVPREERDLVVELRGLRKYFPLLKGAIYRRQVGTVKAVDDIDLDIRRGETLGLVGESGSGKSTTLLEILELGKPQSGTISILGKATASLNHRSRREMRQHIQVVFQDPMAAVDPRMPVFDIIAEPLGAFKWAKKDIEKRVFELLSLVGLESSHADRYPQHFSGGQRQRIGIARALALNPEILILDEPVSALDVSIQAGVINLLADLQGRFGLSYLFVAHDLAVIRHVADRVAVMYLGSIVEIGQVDHVYNNPTHPYTQALISAIPIPDPRVERARQRIVLEGDLPSPANPPSGCKFRTRCPAFSDFGEAKQTRCIDEVPVLQSCGPDHQMACHFGVAQNVL
ncbi:MAG: dipeptide ABC transporter ATP-binding protein [Propionibacteriaceae bacterium]|jgi:peptide/nickel transport system ATP-binding protein|nr:dipeptide ABC transporter ATP-binding protein [Propionibacteriaceae bacterium]